MFNEERKKEKKKKEKNNVEGSELPGSTLTAREACRRRRVGVPMRGGEKGQGEKAWLDRLKK